MFDGFTTRRFTCPDATIHARIGGSGPPLLLLHGYPQTHVMWHAVAPLLAPHFTLVCPDLRGYGDSEGPPSDARHAAYAKRATAADMALVMAELGFERFAVAGHDRGGRVTHRLCLDHPAQVSRAAVLDIVPTATLFGATNQALATGYYHWFFLIQPAPLPERLIGADPLFYLQTKFGQWSGGRSADFLAPEAFAEYARCFAKADVIHKSCEDYRAAASIDLEHDAADADRRIACPLLVLWGEQGLMDRHFDVLDTWRSKVSGPVSGQSLPCGHFLPEEQPEATAAALLAFFRT